MINNLSYPKLDSTSSEKILSIQRLKTGHSQQTAKSANQCKALKAPMILWSSKNHPSSAPHDRMPASKSFCFFKSSAAQLRRLCCVEAGMEDIWKTENPSKVLFCTAKGTRSISHIYQSYLLSFMLCCALGCWCFLAKTCFPALSCGLNYALKAPLDAKTKNSFCFVSSIWWWALSRIFSIFLTHPSERERERLGLLSCNWTGFPTFLSSTSHFQGNRLLITTNRER